MKNTIRKQIENKRKHLSVEYMQDCGCKILDNLINLNILNYDTLMIYNSFRNEVQTHEIIEYLLNNNKNVIAPITNESNISLTPVKISNSKDFIKGAYGILEPIISKNNLVNPNEIQLILIPGVAFDKLGNRIGYGKGYYDRFLSSLNNSPLKVGLCYDFQIVEEIPSETHDIKMDIIISDKKIYDNRG